MKQQVVHILCLQGSCRVHFSGHDFLLEKGSCMIAVASHVGRMEQSPDCVLHTLTIPTEHQMLCMPRDSYGICGGLHLFMHPIFTLSEEELSLIEHGLTEVEYRMAYTPEAYRDAAYMRSLELLYMDVMNAHSRQFQREKVSQRAAGIMTRFIQMLKDGYFRQNRTVEYYADVLCITSKHLHKISTMISGRPPSYWIQQFTVMEIRHMLMHKKMTQKEISDKMGFDSVSHFSRYVSEHLGISPGKV